MTSMNAIYHVLAALVAVERQGVGQEIKLSMIDSLLSFIGPDAMFGHAFIPDDEFRHMSMSRATLLRSRDSWRRKLALRDNGPMTMGWRKRQRRASGAKEGRARQGGCITSSWSTGCGVPHQG